MNECNLTFDYSALVRRSPSKSNGNLPNSLLPQALPHECANLWLWLSQGIQGMYKMS